MSYVCIRSFKSATGKDYRTGGEITSTHYAILTYNDKVNFRKKEEEPSSSSPLSDNIVDSFIPSAFDNVIGSNHSEDNHSNDFGGGDFGGGGASGSWDSGDSGGGE